MCRPAIRRPTRPSSCCRYIVSTIDLSRSFLASLELGGVYIYASTNKRGFFLDLPLIIPHRLMDQPNVFGIQLAALGPIAAGTVVAPDAPNAHLSDDDGGLVSSTAVLGREVGGGGAEVLDLGSEQAKRGGQPGAVGGSGQEDVGGLQRRGRGRRKLGRGRGCR